MTSQISETSVVAIRYASALIDMAVQDGAVEKIEKDLQDLSASISSSPELMQLISNPVVDIAKQAAIMEAIAKKGKFQKLTTNFLGVVVHNKRLQALPAIIGAAFRTMSERRGEVSAKVQTAQPLSAAQTKALKTQLSKTVGSDVMLDVEVDATLLGGMVITMGSRMIDDSVRNKLDKLERVMGKGANVNMLEERAS